MTTPAYAMVALPPCPVGGPTLEQVRAAAADWVNSPPMVDLVRAFGGGPPSGSVEARLSQMEQFSRTVWDFRRGVERDEARWPVYQADLGVLVHAAARALGLAGRQYPAFGAYDHLLVLGGGIRTSLARANFAAGLLRGGVRVGGVSGLGSRRSLGNTEVGAGAALGIPDLVYEADAVEAALRQVFQLPQPGADRRGATKDGQHWWVRSYAAGVPVVHVVAAPSSRPGQRANTADTLTGWAELVVRPTPADRVLVVTTDLFVPFQHCDAVRTLGLRYGCGVDTVGFDSSVSDWVKPRTTAAVLQELRSATWSMRELVRAAAAGPD